VLLSEAGDVDEDLLTAIADDQEIEGAPGLSLSWVPLPGRGGLVVCHASTAGLGGTVWGGHGVRPYDGRCGPLDRSWQINSDGLLVLCQASNAG